jgi:transcriptional regulator with XRE-family HTH domain
MLMRRQRKTYSITEFAKELGVSPITVRRWEAKKAIPMADRDRNDHRVFTERDLRVARRYRDRLVPAPQKRQRSLNLQRT